MTLFLWCFLLLVCVLFALTWTFIETKMVAKRDGKDDQVMVEFKALWGIIKIRIDIPTLKLANWGKGVIFKKEQINENANEETQASSNQVNKRVIKNYLNKFKQLQMNTIQLGSWIKQTLGRIECTSFRWNTRIGLNDAPVTASMVGIAYALKSMLVGYGIHFVQMKGNIPQMSVMPQYNTWDFSTEIQFTCRVRIIHLLSALIGLLIRIMKVPKGFQVWKSVLLKKM